MSSFCSSICSSVVSFSLLVGHLHKFACFCMFVLSLSFSPFCVFSCFFGRFWTLHIHLHRFNIFPFRMSTLPLFPSFCSSSVHLFSLLSRHVFSFLSLFAIFIFLFFLVLDRLFSFLFLFSSFHKNHDCFLLFPKKHDFVCFLSCWTCFTFIFPALYCFSVSWEMLSRFCLNSPFLFFFL